MAKQILLEIDYLKILRKRKHWNIYFTVATNAPGDATKMAVTALPQNGTIQLHKGSDNQIHFVPGGDTGGSGLFVFQQDMPVDSSIQVRLWVMQSRKVIKEVGDIVGDISNFLQNNDGVSEIVNELGIKQPWLFAEKAVNAGIGGVGKALANLKDRNLGFVNMDEHFGHAFDTDTEKDFHNKLSTGYAEIGWTWHVLSDESGN